MFNNRKLKFTLPVRTFLILLFSIKTPCKPLHEYHKTQIRRRYDLPQMSSNLETIEIYFSFHKHMNQMTAIALPLALSRRRSGKRCLLAESNERLQLEIDDRRPGEDPSGDERGASMESGRVGVMSTAEDPTTFAEAVSV